MLPAAKEPTARLSEVLDVSQPQKTGGLVVYQLLGQLRQEFELLPTRVFLLSHSRRGFDENVKIDILGQMAERFRHFHSLVFSMICSDLHHLPVGSHLAMAGGLCS